jgi:hypothetical protein
MVARLQLLLVRSFLAALLLGGVTSILPHDYQGDRVRAVNGASAASAREFSGSVDLLASSVSPAATLALFSVGAVGLA